MCVSLFVCVYDLGRFTDGTRLLVAAFARLTLRGEEGGGWSRSESRASLQGCAALIGLEWGRQSTRDGSWQRERGAHHSAIGGKL